MSRAVTTPTPGNEAEPERGSGWGGGDTKRREGLRSLQEHGGTQHSSLSGWLFLGLSCLHLGLSPCQWDPS